MKLFRYVKLCSIIFLILCNIIYFSDKRKQQINNLRFKKFRNKESSIIHIKTVKDPFGFPHFVHTMEYFYYFTDIIVSNKSKFIIVIEPKKRYKSKYVKSYLNRILLHYDNFIFGNERYIKNKDFTKEYVFDHDKYMQKASFLFNNEIIGNIDVLSWFQNKLSANIIRKNFFPKEINNTKIKIGLVNRKYNRILLNSEEICKKIKKEFGIIVETTLFEKKSFMDQISFFNNHNIIISPHGAQLCSIPFMPENSLVIECCHEEWHPYYYFPGLSITSHKIHAMICSNHSVFPKRRDPKYTDGQKRYNITADSNKINKVILSYINGNLNNNQVYLM